MRMLPVAMLLLSFSLRAADVTHADVANNAEAIRRAYKEIKDQSSPGFQKLKDAIAKGESDTDAVNAHYNDVIARLEFLKQLRIGINNYNAYVAASNKALDSEADDVQDAAERQKELADIESRKSYTATTNGQTDSTAYIVRADGSIATVDSTAVSTSTTTIRENRATAQARANVQKEDIQSDADKKQARLAAGKLSSVPCTVSLEQIKALEEGEKTKFKYLLDKAAK